MNIFECQNHNNEHMNIHQGIHRKSAADIPPFSNTAECPQSKNKHLQSPKLKIFEDLLDEVFDGSLDSDKLLIGALIYMLIKEGADIKLIIALGYILM